MKMNKVIVFNVLFKTALLRQINIELPYYPVIPLLNIYPKTLKAGTQAGICIPMFIGALFTIKC